MPLSCAGLSAGYGGEEVLHGVTLRMKPGSLYGLLGPNGSGKTTLLKSLARLHRPDSGSVSLGARELYARMGEREAARIIAYVPQEENLAFPLTVREVVGLGRTPWLGRFGWPGRRDTAAVNGAIKEMDLEAIAGAPFDEISGGERKRTIIARALAQEARILLLDEPTAHLDVAHALALWTLLGRLSRRGRTVAVASHEMWHLARFCRTLFLVEKGRLALSGSPARVLGNPACGRAFGVKISLARRGGSLTPIIN
jgi:iron complex transport system ATP-binding protein